MDAEGSITSITTRETNGIKEKEEEAKFAPLVVLLGGPATGKTEIGDTMQASGEYIFHDVDRIRIEVCGHHNGVRKEESLELEEMERSYFELFRRAKSDLLKGKKVVIAATMSSVASQENIMKIAEEAGVPFDAFVFTATREKLEENMKKREEEGSDSNFLGVEDALEKDLQVWGSLGRSKLPVYRIDISETKTSDGVFEKMKSNEIKKVAVISQPTPALAAD